MLDFANTSSVTDLWKRLTNHFRQEALTPLEFSTTTKKLLNCNFNPLSCYNMVKNSCQNKFFIVYILLSLFYTDWTTTNACKRAKDDRRSS